MNKLVESEVIFAILVIMVVGSCFILSLEFNSKDKRINIKISFFKLGDNGTKTKTYLLELRGKGAIQGCYSYKRKFDKSYLY